MIKTPKGSCFRGLFYYYHFNQALAEEFPADAGLVGILGSLKPVFFSCLEHSSEQIVPTKYCGDRYISWPKGFEIESHTAST
jgi:hypothetical protein